MSEDDISREMFRAAIRAPEVLRLSWQAVSGKSYFTYDLRIPVGTQTMAPDLVLLSDGAVWIVEIKGTHHESAAIDEPKLALLRASLTPDEILAVVSATCRLPRDWLLDVQYAVAYSTGNKVQGCIDWIHHFAWEDTRPSLPTAITRASTV